MKRQAALVRELLEIWLLPETDAQLNDDKSQEGVGILTLLLCLLTAIVCLLLKLPLSFVQSPVQAKARAEINVAHNLLLLNHPMGFGAGFSRVGQCWENEFELGKTAQTGLGASFFYGENSNLNFAWKLNGGYV